MGVGGLRAFVANNFKNCSKTVPKGIKNNLSTDYLLIDSQGLIHKASNEVFRYRTEHVEFMSHDFYVHLTIEEKERKVYEIFFELLMEIIETIQPKKLVYCALDGAVATAKIAQQRQRRFRTAAERDIHSTAFDPSAMSPGTHYNYELSQALKCYIRMMLNDPKYADIKVILAPNTSAGEGEHKIMDYVRNLTDTEKATNRFTIAGNDGDLFMLCLSLNLPKINFLREDERGASFTLFDVSQMSQQLPEVLKYKGRISSDDLNRAFIFIAFFVGNDFLPMFAQYPHDFKNVFPTVLEFYLESCNHGVTTENVMVVDKELNYNGIVKFVEVIASHEYSDLQTLANTRSSELDNKNVELIQSLEQGKLNFDKFRDLYYKKVIGKDYTEKDVKKMCCDYLKTQLWTYKYYVETVPDWTWFYKYYYTPLMSDYLVFLREYETFPRVAIDFVKHEPIKPFVQLLSVLPRHSYKLVPKELQEVMLNKDSALKGNYPDKIKIDYTGKIMDHQGIVLLPFPDIEKITEIYDGIAKNSALNTMDENVLTNNYLFEYSNNKEARKYVSKYGKIAYNHVVVWEVPNESHEV